MATYGHQESMLGVQSCQSITQAPYQCIQGLFRDPDGILLVPNGLDQLKGSVDQHSPALGADQDGTTSRVGVGERGS